MTDLVKSRFESPDAASHLLSSPEEVDELTAHVRALQGAVSEAMRVAHAAGLRSEQVQSDYERVLGGTSLDERLARFEAFLVQKVKGEMLAHSPHPSDSAASTSLILAPTHPEEESQRNRAVRQVQLHQQITSEALRAKTAALEQRQSLLESKLNALVSDFVLTNQSTHNEMKSFGNTLRSQMRRHREDVCQQLELAMQHASRDGGSAGTLPLVERRMGEMVKVMALLDARTQEAQSSLDAAEEQWFVLMSRLVEKVSELTLRVGQLEENAHTPYAAATIAVMNDAQPQIISDPALQVHLRVVEEAMCHFAEDLERLRDDVQKQQPPPLSRPSLENAPRSAAATVAAAHRGEGSRCRAGVHANVAAQLLAAQQQRLVRMRFFQTWKRAAEEKTRREKDEMFLSVLRAHQEEIHRLKERVDATTETCRKPQAGSKREQAALVKELQKCIRVAIADKSNPPSVHVCRALQAMGNWAEQVDHMTRSSGAV